MVPSAFWPSMASSASICLRDESAKRRPASPNISPQRGTGIISCESVSKMRPRRASSVRAKTSSCDCQLRDAQWLHVSRPIACSYQFVLILHILQRPPRSTQATGPIGAISSFDVRLWSWQCGAAGLFALEPDGLLGTGWTQCRQLLQTAAFRIAAGVGPGSQTFAFATSGRDWNLSGEMPPEPRPNEPGLGPCALYAEVHGDADRTERVGGELLGPIAQEAVGSQGRDDDEGRRRLVGQVAPEEGEAEVPVSPSGAQAHAEDGRGADGGIGVLTRAEVERAAEIAVGLRKSRPSV